MSTDPVRAKQTIRDRIRRLRREAAPQSATAQIQLDSLLRQLLSTLNPSGVFAYLATPGEAATTATIDALLATGHAVSVPAIVDRTSMVATRFPGWSALVPGRLGILSPPSAEPSTGPLDCVLVPGLAFSLTGGRLGYGAGYYDRWLAAHPAAVRIGLCFEYQIDPAVPLEPHDEMLDYLVTERRIIVCTVLRAQSRPEKTASTN